jgi:phenylacetate-CoA ligase
MNHGFKSVERFDRWPSLTGAVWRTGPGRGIPMLGFTVDEIFAVLLDRPAGHLLLRPAVLSGVLDRVEATGRRPEGLGQIMCYGETVAPALREACHRLLGTHIADRYSCEELGPLAFQCPTHDSHYHVASSNVVVEAVDDSGNPVAPGVLGNLVVTGLSAMATPILRYDIGDMARLLPRCACGHAGPAMTDLLGRRRSLLRLPDGRLVYYRLLASPLLAIAPVRKFRILQLDRTTLVVEVTAERPLDDTEKDGIAALVRSDTSEALMVRVERVPRIDWGAHGKRVTVVNLAEDPPA